MKDIVCKHGVVSFLGLRAFFVLGGLKKMRTIHTDGDQFYSPFSSALVKGEEENGRWIVYLQASNEGLDQDEEVVMCKALKDAADYYLSHGILSYDHQHKRQNDPKFIVGEPLDIAFNDKNETMIKGFLYKENEIAKSLWDNIRSGAKKLGASVGGGILKKAADVSNGIKGKIIRVIWDETAITHKPVNDGTLGKVSIIPFAEFAKALMAGGGVDAAAFEGGRALTAESLQGVVSDISSSVPYEELRRLFDSLFVSIRKGTVKSYNDVMEFILSRGYPPSVSAELIRFVSRKLPSINSYFGG